MKKNVVVIMGGKTPEYEISIISGKEVVRNLDKNKYKVFPTIVSRDGTSWKAVSPRKLLLLKDPLSLIGTQKEIVPFNKNELVAQDEVLGRGKDIIFIAMHGPYGEDGTVQGMLELAGVPYTGSGVLASAIGMDKLIFRKLMSQEKIPIPKYVAVKKGEPLTGFRELGKPPYFVKPHNQGSSVGASIVRHKGSLAKALKTAFAYSDTVLIDEYIKGTEVTCSILGNQDPKALPIIEIVPLKGEFFDYQSKYTESGAEEIVPARISKALTRAVQELSLRVYKAIGCRGFARVDFLLKANKFPVVLEINTIPGLTPMSLLPKAAYAAGFSYPKLLDKIINYALQK